MQDTIGSDTLKTCPCCWPLGRVVSGDFTWRSIRRLCSNGRRSSTHQWLLTHPDACANDPACRVTLPLGDGRFTEPVHPDQWPVPVRGSDQVVEFVIRQWVEERPSDSLARLYATLPSWRAVLAKLEADLTFEEQSPTREEMLLRIRATLFRYGLPAAPGTIDFIAQQFHTLIQHDNPFIDADMDDPGQPIAGPTRAILVTSVALRPNLDGVAETGGVVTQLSYAGPFTNDALRRSALKVAAEHGRWVAQFKDTQLPRVDLRALNGRPLDPLGEDIARFRSRELQEHEVRSRALDRERELNPKHWDPRKKQRVLRVLSCRLYRARKTLESDNVFFD